jgi:hypothetical protein
LLRFVSTFRENSLFVGSLEAGERYVNLLTLLLNCEIVGVNPYVYMVDVIDKLAADGSFDRAAELLPRAWLAARQANSRAQAQAAVVAVTYRLAVVASSASPRLRPTSVTDGSLISANTSCASLARRRGGAPRRLSNRTSESNERTRENCGRTVRATCARTVRTTCASGTLCSSSSSLAGDDPDGVAQAHKHT